MKEKLTYPRPEVDLIERAMYPLRSAVKIELLPCTWRLIAVNVLKSLPFLGNETPCYRTFRRKTKGRLEVDVTILDDCVRLTQIFFNGF